MNIAFCSLAFADSYEDAFSIEHCGGDCSQKMSLEYKQNDPLSMVEQYVVELYTQDNHIEDLRILLSAVNKLPSKVLKTFRGGSSSSYGITEVGQVVQLNKITSVSSSQQVAENFIKDQLIVMNVKSGRDISRYSVVGEQELLLLPGTKLHVDKISTIKIDMSVEDQPDLRDIRLVELTEVP